MQLCRSRCQGKKLNKEKEKIREVKIIMGRSFYLYGGGSRKKKGSHRRRSYDGVKLKTFAGSEGGRNGRKFRTRVLPISVI